MQDSIQKMIINAVDDRRDQIISFLQALIRFDSETGKEAEIQGFIANKLRHMGLEVDTFVPDIAAMQDHPAFVAPEIPFEDRPNVVGVYHGSGGGRSLLFNGHVDTVPTSPNDEWIDGPLSGAVRDGAVWGRGASDMKGGLAAMTMALAILLEIGRDPTGNVILEYTVDEETTGMGTLACVLRGYRADAGICCETSEMEVMPACIGRLWFKVQVRGKPSGIATRWESVSAINKGLKVVQAVEDLEIMRVQDLKHSLYPDNRGALPCAVTMFHSGTHPSVTPEEAILQGSLGLMPYEEIEEVKRQLQEQIHNLAMADPWLRNNPPEVTFDKGLVAPGAEIALDHPIVELLKTSYRTVTGLPPVLSARKGAADTRFLIRYGDTPTVIFGPGETAQMHAMNEHMPIENLINATKILALAVEAW